MNEFELREPKWNFREYVRHTWHHWLFPLFGALMLTVNIFFPMRPSWFLGLWAFYYLVHTWMLTRSLMWHRKFQDCIAECYQHLTKEAFVAGVEAGRTEDKPWLQP